MLFIRHLETSDSILPHTTTYSNLDLQIPLIAEVVGKIHSQGPHIHSVWTPCSPTRVKYLWFAFAWGRANGTSWEISVGNS